MRKILHISDVHFGPPHRPELESAVLEFADERRPDLVALSGDLTQRARPEQFAAARVFVDRLPAPSVVVPGNHDVPLFRVWERLLSPFHAYRKHFSEDLEPVFEDEELLAVGINTAHAFTLSEGKISLRRLEAVEEVLKNGANEKLKIVVAHHHLIPPPRFGTQSVVGNAYEAIEVFADSGVELVLSGHQHQTYIATSEEFYPAGRRPFIIVHTGTATSSRGRASEKEQNTFNWIEVDHRLIAITPFRWDVGEARFVQRSRHVYPRRHREPYTIEGTEEEQD